MLPLSVAKEGSTPEHHLSVIAAAHFHFDAREQSTPKPSIQMASGHQHGQVVVSVSKNCSHESAEPLFVY